MYMLKRLVFFFILGSSFLFWDFLTTHLTNGLFRDCVCPDAFAFPFCGKDIVLWLTPGCICSLRRGDSTLLGPGPACAILRQFRSLCHHVGHRREKRDGHRAPRTQVRLLLVFHDVSHSLLAGAEQKHQSGQDRNIVTGRHLDSMCTKACSHTCFKPMGVLLNSHREMWLWTNKKKKRKP